MTFTLEAAAARELPGTDLLRPLEPGPLAIAADRCKGCELCISVCAPGVLALDEAAVNRLGYHPIRLTDPSGCTSCAKCARMCPDAVFTVFAPPRER
jgi:2-oxoglutarate ferredoxin oxidoreductase subunit delta